MKDPLTGKIIGCAIEVHRVLGPGLLESSYQRCLSYELVEQHVEHDLEVPASILYKKVRIACAYRVDMVVDEKVVVELKAVEQITPLHKAQILTDMRLLGIPTGLLINFNVTRLAEGIHRFKI